MRFKKHSRWFLALVLHHGSAQFSHRFCTLSLSLCAFSLSSSPPQDAQEENIKLRQSFGCSICMENEVDRILVPCGHLICKECVHQVRPGCCCLMTTSHHGFIVSLANPIVVSVAAA